jgi:pyruvate-ferredoxin/flavodoxin oxidoreductase
MSKSTPRGAVAKFAAGGKPAPKKDLGRLAMSYGNVYVAQIAMGASDLQTVKAFAEAEAYDGPSIIIAYSHCIAHGINMRTAMDNQKAAVQSGHWPMYRYNPALALEGKNPLQLDYKKPKIRLEEYAYMENRYKILTKTNPEEAKRLLNQAQHDADERWRLYEQLAGIGHGAETKP